MRARAGPSPATTCVAFLYKGQRVHSASAARSAFSDLMAGFTVMMRPPGKGRTAAHAWWFRGRAQCPVLAAQRPPPERNMLRPAQQAVHEHEFMHCPAHGLDDLVADDALVIEQRHMRRELSVNPAP